MTLTAVLVASAVAVLAFDVVASLASLRFGIEYARFSIGSFALYAVAGAAAIATGGPWWSAPLAGATTGLVESTAGWAISSRLGAGLPPAPVAPAGTADLGPSGPPQATHATPGAGAVGVAVTVSAAGAVIGVFGGLLVTVL